MRVFFWHAFEYMLMIDIAFIQNERDLVLETVNRLLRFLVLDARTAKRSEFIFKLVEIFPGISAIVIAFEIMDHGVSSIR
ncbi:hypothetical protein FHS14_005339 [Paenibacillus baekrokdamisoli]|nr:hypothetical protein [Paenibacillus baekrokdamisoli]